MNEWVDNPTSVDVGKLFWFVFRGSGMSDVFVFFWFWLYARFVIKV